MASRTFRSLQDVSAGLRMKLPPCDLTRALQAAFRLQAGDVEARRRGDALQLTPRDRTIRFALEGMEPQILAWLTGRGEHGIRRITWSAE
jgi:hypothetical protein